MVIRESSLYRTPKERKTKRPPLPPKVLQTSFMLQRWLLDRQLDIKILYKRAHVTKVKANMFIYEYEENMKAGTMNVRFDEVLRLQQAAQDIDHEIFAYIYDSWL